MMDIFRKIEISANRFRDKLFVDELLPDAEAFPSEIKAAEQEYKITEEDMKGLNLGGRDASLEDLLSGDPED